MVVGVHIVCMNSVLSVGLCGWYGCGVMVYVGGGGVWFVCDMCE